MAATLASLVFGPSVASPSSESKTADTLASSDVDTLTVVQPSDRKKEVKEHAPRTLGTLKMLAGKRGRTYRTRLGYIGALTTGATGILNAAVNCSTLPTTSEFTAFASLFDEYFIHSFTVMYEPNNQFFGPCNLDAAPFNSWGSTLLMGAPLYHGAPAYSSASDMVNNVDHRTLHSGRPWTVKWVNNEKPTGGVVVTPTTSTPVATQSWCLMSGPASGLYTGTYQFRTSLPLPFTSAKTLGQTVITFDVTFRARV
jgi:hypothetical protein